MVLKETIETEYKNALKAKDKTKISTYRLILSSIKDLDIVNRSGPNKKETDDEDIKKLLKKMVKQRAGPKHRERVRGRNCIPRGQYNRCIYYGTYPRCGWGYRA